MIKRTVTIKRPAKSAMQSGQQNTRKWELTVHSDATKWVDPTMGWISGDDTTRQLKLIFDSEAQAIAYAKHKNLTFEIIDHPGDRALQPKSYANNFAFSKRRYFDGVGDRSDLL